MAIFDKEVMEIEWKIIPQNTPRILRNCNRCGKKREFYSSDLFRLNAQQKNIDVWLIYKCLHCQSTWNATIYTRINPQKIEKEKYQKMIANDKELAWHYAFSNQMLKTNNADVMYETIEYTIEGEDINILESPILKVKIESQYNFAVRLDRVLKNKLRLTKDELYKYCDENIITFDTNIEIRKYKMKEGILKFSINSEKLNSKS